MAEANSVRSRMGASHANNPIFARYTTALFAIEARTEPLLLLHLVCL